MMDFSGEHTELGYTSNPEKANTFVNSNVVKRLVVVKTCFLSFHTCTHKNLAQFIMYTVFTEKYHRAVILKVGSGDNGGP